MKDRIEARFTISTSKVDSKALKVIGKALESKLDRLLESITKAIEGYVEFLVEEKLGPSGNED